MVSVVKHRRLWFGWGMRLATIAFILALASTARAASPAFTPMTPIALAVGDDAGPQAVALADLNKDGITDMVVIDRDDDVIHVLLGVGDGTFHEPIDYEIDGTPTAVAVADVASSFASDRAGDIDGNVDIIIADEDGFAEILLGRGDGSFDPPEQDLSDALDSLELIGVAVRDLDNNGRLDLIFLDAFDEVYFLCNEGGVFAPCATDYVCTEGDGAIDFAVTDFDVDGQFDVAVLSVDSMDTRIIRGLGGGNFEPSPSQVFSVLGDPVTPVAIEAAALDDVGGDELVVAQGGAASSALLVLSFANGSTHIDSVGGDPDPRAIAIADVDGNGVLDLVNATGATPPLRVAFGDGSRGFGALESPAGLDAIGVARTVVAGAIDADSRPDLALVSDLGDAVQILVNATTAAPGCGGDCNGDGLVVINELLTGVNIAIGNQPVSQCAAFDADDSNSVAINELIAAVRNALEGCPA